MKCASYLLSGCPSQDIEDIDFTFFVKNVNELIKTKDEKTQNILREEGIFENDNPLVLQDNPNLIRLIGKGTIKCRLPDESKSIEDQLDELPIRDQVRDLQMHGHTGTCWKNKKRKVCRFGFPRPPSERILIAKPKGEDYPELEKTLGKYQDILTTAKKILIDLDDTEDKEAKVLEEIEKAENLELATLFRAYPHRDKMFIWFINELRKKVKHSGIKNYTFEMCDTDYYDALETSERGQLLILERKVQERNVNNYEEEWLHIWDANMDIQLAFDPFAVITYVIEYVGKDEKGVTKFMNSALNGAKHLPLRQKLKALQYAFVTHRQCGASECIYRLTSGLHLRESNITCIFVATGFPEHRQGFYRKVADQTNEPDVDFDTEDQEEVSEENPNEVPIEVVSIEGRPGKFLKTISIDERYILRPSCVKDMCLAQFATHYVYQKNVVKKYKFDASGKGVIDDPNFVDNCPDYYLFNDKGDPLPKRIKLLGENNGYMRLRTKPAVLKIHSCKKKEGHEKYYAEMMLFMSWSQEEHDIPRNSELCIMKYEKKRNEIEVNKKGLFRFASTMDLLDSDVQLDEACPTHIYDELDPELEQHNNEKDNIVGEVDPEFAGRHHDHVDPNAEQVEDNTMKEFRYKAIDIPEEQDMKVLLKKLVPEQQYGLDKVVKYCTDIIKNGHRSSIPVDPLRLIIHGGSGMTI